jgi:hypothetical protein
MHADRRAHHLVPGSLLLDLDRLRHRRLRARRREGEHLLDVERPHLRLQHRLEGRDAVGDLADRGGARVAHPAQDVGDGLEGDALLPSVRGARLIVRRSVRRLGSPVAALEKPAHPVRESVAAGHGRLDLRVGQMRVSVDDAWHQHLNVASLGDTIGKRSARADLDDQTADVDEHVHIAHDAPVSIEKSFGSNENHASSSSLP